MKISMPFFTYQNICTLKGLHYFLYAVAGLRIPSFVTGNCNSESTSLTLRDRVCFTRLFAKTRSSHIYTSLLLATARQMSQDEPTCWPTSSRSRVSVSVSGIMMYYY